MIGSEDDDTEDASQLEQAAVSLGRRNPEVHRDKKEAQQNDGHILDSRIDCRPSWGAVVDHFRVAISLLDACVYYVHTRIASTH